MKFVVFVDWTDKILTLSIGWTISPVVYEAHGISSSGQIKYRFLSDESMKFGFSSIERKKFASHTSSRGLLSLVVLFLARSISLSCRVSLLRGAAGGGPRSAAVAVGAWGVAWGDGYGGVAAT